MKRPGKGMGWKEFFLALKREYKRDKVGDTAAGLTYYAILAIFPFLLALVAVAGIAIDPRQLQRLVEELSTVAPQEVAGIVGGQLRELASRQSGVLTLGFVLAIWSASAGMAALVRALNTAYDVEEGRKGWKVRLLAIGMTLLTAVVALAAAAIAIATPALAGMLGEPLGTIVTWLRLPVAGLLMMLLWAFYYWALPDTEQSFRFVSPGSVVGVLIWIAASWAFSVYVQNFGNYNATYGALGGVIVMLLWMWISAQVVLIGAEINAVLEHASPEGKRPGAKRLGEKGEVSAREQAEGRKAPPPAGRDEGERPRTLH